jgi:glyoxylase-like metal-dependent hydrolase (beta-lactamase superfamily II)
MPTDNRRMKSVSHNPRSVLDTIWAFPPNRETLGGTAYFIVENSQNILIDCPSWTAEVQSFLEQQGGVHKLVLTHRQGMSPAILDIQNTFGTEVILQEQEAYLLPKVAVTSFQTSIELTSTIQVLWTPGHSPGSSCVYYQPQGVLFTGRHLLPDATGQLKPIRTAKTFHWLRQLRSVKLLLERFTPETLRYFCPGAHIGFLRQQRVIGDAYDQLQQLDLAALQQTD